MTIATTLARNDYPGAGTTGPFTYGFRVFAYTDLEVIKRSIAGAETTLAYPVDFAGTGAGNAAGGTITLTTALAIGERIAIRRAPPVVQTTSLKNLGSYYPQSHEDAFDRLVMIDQGQQDQLDRSIKLKRSLDPAGRSLELEPTAGYVVVGDGTGFTTAVIDRTGVVLPGAGRTVTTLSAYLINNAYITPKDFGAVGDKIADDTVPVQNAINAARDQGIFLRGGGWQYRITSGLTTQHDGVYKPVWMDWDTSTIFADFVGAPAFTIIGGAATQYIRRLHVEPTLARRLAVGGAYVAANTGILISNAAVDVQAEAYYFGGDGVLISTTAPNSNRSTYNLQADLNGRGIRVTGTNDNLSVSVSRFRTYSNSTEGIRVDDTAAMRQWTGHWYAEANWQSDPNNVANYGVYIGKATTCDLVIYSEQTGTANEIWTDATNVVNCDILSLRRNKDVINGSNAGKYGVDRYQTGDANRRSTPRSYTGLNTRKANTSEWVDVLLKAGDGVIGRVRGEALGMHLLSASAVLSGPTAVTQGQGTSVGATDKFAYAGRKRIYSDLVPLSAGTQTRTIAICNVTSASVITGRLTVSGVSGGGAGIMTSVIDFRVDGTTLTANAAIVSSAAGPNPSTAVFSVTAGVLQVVFTYVSAQWGASYSFDYAVEGTFINVT